MASDNSKGGGIPRPYGMEQLVDPIPDFPPFIYFQKSKNHNLFNKCQKGQRPKVEMSGVRSKFMWNRDRG